MSEFSNEFWVQMVVYGISIGAFAGVTITKLSIIRRELKENKVFIERFKKVETEHNLLKCISKDEGIEG